jgi:two-component system, cell cycle response regulator DivK
MVQHPTNAVKAAGVGRRARPLILIVDDDEDNREMYSAYLSRRGFDVDTAGDGASALDRAYTIRPDLVVMDLTLPDMDGVEAILQLRKDPRTAEVPVVVVSGYRLDSVSADGVCWDAFLTKPCLPDELTDTIRRLVKTSINVASSSESVEASPQ